MKSSVFERLVSEAKSSRVRASLEALNDTCIELFDNGSRDFSIATVVRAGKGRGVPQTQTIRNKTGLVYRQLLEGWMVEHGTSNKRSTNSSTKWIDRIEDPTLRYLAHDLLVKNRNLESELQLFRSVKTLEIDMRAGQDDLFNGLIKLKLVSTEVKTLKNAVKRITLGNKGLKVGERGCVLDDQGDVVFERGFVSAIDKVIASQSEF